MTFSITTLSTKVLIVAVSTNDNQHNDTVSMPFCRVSNFIRSLPNDIMLNVVMPNVVLPLLSGSNGLNYGKKSFVEFVSRTTKKEVI
jgi:hypothetical protein